MAYDSASRKTERKIVLSVICLIAFFGFLAYAHQHDVHVVHTDANYKNGICHFDIEVANPRDCDVDAIVELVVWRSPSHSGGDAGTVLRRKVSVQLESGETRTIHADFEAGPIGGQLLHNTNANVVKVSPHFQN